MNLHDIVKKGSVNRSVAVTIIDTTTGLPETGVVWNTAGIDLWYRREGAAVTSITEATLATLATAHTDGGFLAISHGEYRLDLPDAAFATGANYVDFGGTVTGMVVIGGRVRLVDVDLEDSVRAGLTALPNAAAAAAGGLIISTAGTTDADDCLTATGFATPTNITAASGIVLSGVTHTGAVIPTVSTLTGHTAQTGDSFARIGVAGAGLTNLGASGNNWNVGKTGYSLTATTGLGNQTANVTGNLSGSVGSVTGAVGSVTSGVTVTTNNDKTGYLLSDAGIDAIYDEAISGHLTSGTFGLYLTVAGGILVDATVSGTPTATEIQFTGGVDSPDFYADQTAWVFSGTGIGQNKPIVSSSYSAGTTTLTLDEACAISAVSGDRVLVKADHVHPLSQIQSGLATATALQTVDNELATMQGNVTSILADSDVLQTEWADGGRLDLLLDGAASAGDPWTTSLPGAYGVGTAGKIVGDNINATITSRMAEASINTTAGAIDNVTLTTTCTTNTDMRGTDNAATEAKQDATDALIAELTTQGDTNEAKIDTISTAVVTTIPGLIDDIGIKKNTAFSNFEFLMVLTSDHVTPATGLTVTAQRSIDGAAFAAVGGSIAEVSNGIYQFDALAADTNGDVITWRFSSATADDNFFTFKTVA